MAREPEKPARERASSGSPFEPQFGFSRAVRTGTAISVAGTGPIWPDGHVDPDVSEQTRRCLEIIETALAELGAALGDVVRTRIFLVDAADADAVGPVHREAFGSVLPASTIVVVAGLLDPRWRIEIEADAVLDDRRP